MKFWENVRTHSSLQHRFTAVYIVFSSKAIREVNHKVGKSRPKIDSGFANLAHFVTRGVLFSDLRESSWRKFLKITVVKYKPFD